MHSSVKVTEKHYVTLDLEHVRSAIDHLDFGVSCESTGGKPESKPE
jgi:hypothetical protein